MIPVKNWAEIEAVEREMRAAKGANILQLFKIAKLDPHQDFRCQDWRFVKFDGLVLRDFDFEHSRVYGSSFVGAQVAGAKFRGSDVQTTRFYLAEDWELADLSDEQRNIIKMQSLVAGGMLDRESFEQLHGWESIDERQWVRMIKTAADFDRAHDLYKMMSKVQMGRSKYAITTLLDKAVSTDQVATAKGYFAALNIPLDSFAVSALISKSKSEEDARKIFFQYKDSCEHTTYLYNSLIAKCQFLETADDIFKMMESEGLQVDEIALNPFIWKAESFRSALWIYNKMPNPRTADLNALLSHAKWHQYFKSKEVIDLITNGPPLDQRTFNVIIGTCDNLSDGLSVIVLMKTREFKPDKFTLFSTLSLIANGDVDRCFDLLIQFIDDKVLIEDRDVVRQTMRIVDDHTGRAERIVTELWDMEDSWYHSLVKLSEAFASAERNARFRAAIDKSRTGRASQI